METKRVKINLSEFNNSDEKKRGIKINRFFIQLFNRINFKYLNYLMLEFILIIVVLTIGL